MKKIFYLFLLLFLSFQAFSQIDKEFWFVAPEVSANHGDSPDSMRISTMADTAHIILRMPSDLFFAPITHTIFPNSTYSINLTPWKDTIENKPADQVLNKGLLLTSDNNITAYYEVANASNPGISSLKGKNALGTEFYISGQTDYANYTNDGSEAFDIVATEDNTTIIITPSIAITGHAANVPFVIHLQKGQTYSARTTITIAGASLAGSHVVSDKPVAITIMDDSIITGGWDEITDQTIPTNLLGVNYIVIKGFADNVPPSNDDERVYILATHNNTDIWLNGNATPITTLATGQQYDYAFPATDNTVVIKASNPVYVYHLSGQPGEAGSTIIPQDSCTGSRQIGFTRSTTNAFAMLILTRNGNQDSFYLNGNNGIITAANFNVVPGTGNAWVYYRQNNLPLGQVVKGVNQIWNTKGKFHFGFMHMLGGSAEYAYFSDFSSLYLGADRSLCPGDSIVLDGGADRSSYDWKWDSVGVWVTIDTNRYLIVKDSGNYACATNGDYCELRDTIHIGLYPGANVNLGPDTIICQGVTLMLDPGSFVSYLWQNSGTGRYMIAGTPGIYWVRVTNNNGCSARDTIIVTLDSIPKSPGMINGLTTVCQGQNGVTYSVDPIQFASAYTWTIPGGTSGSSTTNSIILNFSTSAVSDTLRVKGHNYCGDGPEGKLFITVNPLPGPAGAITGPATVCQGQNGVTFSVASISNATSYLWSIPPGSTVVSGSGTNTITVNFNLSASPGNFSVNSHNDCGDGSSASLAISVNLFPLPAGVITGSSTVCPGQTGVIYSVPAITGADSYSWSVPSGATITNGAGTNTITVSFDLSAVSGNIGVLGHSNNCGDGIPSSFLVTLHPFPSLPGTIMGTNPVCQGQNGVIYHVDPVTDATSYIWTIPPGTTGSSATDSITLNFFVSAVSDTLRIRGHNYCGDGPITKLAITVNPLPLAAGSITGPSTVCQGQTGVVFSIVPVSYATTYNWSVPAGATIISGAGTNSIIVNFSLSFTPGTISVYGQNSCGTGASSSKSIGVTLFPLPAGTITGTTPVCQGQSGITYTVPVISGADSYIWTVPTGVTVTGGGGTNTITVKFDSLTAVSGNITVKGHSNSCGDGIPSGFPVIVNPLPVPAGTIAGGNPVCQSQTGVNYSVPFITAATSYTWTVPSGATIISGSGTNSIVVDFDNTAISGNITVHGHNALCGDGKSSALSVTVNHLPQTAGIINGTTPVCQAQNNVSYSISPVQYASSYVWYYSGTGGSITNNGNTIKINFSSSATSGVLSVKGHNNCGDGPLSPDYAVTVNPIPLVTLNICNNVMTHDAQSFKLKGGIPLGGTFSGTGVLGTIFNPASVPGFKDTAQITYSYTNMFTCTSRAKQTLSLLVVQPFICGNNLVDIRDNKSYATVKIGTQCWMAVNLDYGTVIPSSALPFDNCTGEKYCFNDNPVNCTSRGGLYHWDELMQYEEGPGLQGLCPSGWHIPTETEWTLLFNQYINNGFAASPLKYTGYSGFNALLPGLRHENITWDFDAFATMFWTSNIHSTTKAMAHGMNTYDPSVSLYPSLRSNTFSVRCLKD
ncbi:MAG: hypothetical protein NTX61_15400 [Bacteroidetes bacterium]|nr:hypothetical protein [Bacteroidota bacterium]